MRNYALLLCLLAGSVFFTSCVQLDEKEETIYVGVSKASPDPSYGHYIKWLQKADTTILYIDLYPLGTDSAVKVLQKCSGLLLTGGPDIFPGRYNREEDTTLTEAIDHYRDTLEYALMKDAQDMKLPVLGVCRGAQLINVFFGGSLVADIPSQTESGVEHRCEVAAGCTHEIKVMPGSTLKSIVTEGMGSVNSNHHQAVKDLAPNLRVSARTEDGLPEAIEWMDPLGKPFLLGVQWHPERMDPSSPFSGPVARAFIEEAHLYQNLIKDEINYKRR